MNKTFSFLTVLIGLTTGYLTSARQACAAGPVYADALVTGFAHTCALVSGVVFCWGDNRYGQVGDGTTERRLRPVRLESFEKGSVQLLVAGYNHTCALLSNGKVSCWGDNRYGQIGIAIGQKIKPLGNRLSPAVISGLDGEVQTIAAGQYHTCAAIRRGALYCWGSNRRGQLGNLDYKPSPNPVAVYGVGARVKAIAGGAAHTCVLMEDGKVWCWGFNGSGQLGDGTFADRLAPTLVTGLAGRATGIGAGGFHTCATLVAEGSSKTTLQCWGNNSFGQLGSGETKNLQVANAVVGIHTPVQQLAIGFYHSCVLLAGDEVYCWGSNESGQLGDGTNELGHLAPVIVKDLGAGVAAVGAGVDHSCALFKFSVRCWGSNDLGQFGNRTSEGSRAPDRSVVLLEGSSK